MRKGNLILRWAVIFCLVCLNCTSCELLLGYEYRFLINKTELRLRDTKVNLYDDKQLIFSDSLHFTNLVPSYLSFNYRSYSDTLKLKVIMLDTLSTTITKAEKDIFISLQDSGNHKHKISVYPQKEFPALY